MHICGDGQFFYITDYQNFVDDSFVMPVGFYKENLFSQIESMTTTTQFSLSSLDRVQKWLCDLVGDVLFSPLQPYSYKWNVASLSLL